MEKGFLLLTGNYYDLVHYIKIDDVFYTLSRDNVEKIEDINNNVDFYIKYVDLKELEETRIEDPYFLNEPKLTNTDREKIIKDDSFEKVNVIINRNRKQIEQFQKLSVENDFAYFADIKSEEIVLLQYKIENNTSF